jgi:hypothetical protein
MAVVSLEDNRHTLRRYMTQRQLKKLTHGSDHSLVVCIKQIGPTVGVASDVNLHNSRLRKAPEFIRRAASEVKGIDIEIVHVEQYAAARPDRQLGEEVAFRHLLVPKGDVGRRVFEAKAVPDDLLYLLDAFGDVP